MISGTRSIRIIRLAATKIPVHAALATSLRSLFRHARIARALFNRREPATAVPASVATGFTLLIAIIPLGTALAQSGYTAQEGYGKSNPFLESMQLMMDAMRSAGRADQAGSWGNAPLDWSQYAPSGGWPGFGGSGYTLPWSSGQFPGQQQAQQMMRGMGAPQGLPFVGTSLDGIWQGRSGEVLVIWGQRFRIYSDSNRFTEGDLRVQGNQLWLHNPMSNTTQRYEYAAHEGRLALRDVNGQLLLYRRADTRR